MIKWIITILGCLFLSGCFSKFQAEKNKNFLLNPLPVDDAVLSGSFKVFPSLATNDCGVVAEQQSLYYMGYTDLTREEIVDYMEWHRNIPDISDTVINHKLLLNELNINHKITLNSANLRDISERIRANTPVIVLLRFSLTDYHWAVVTSVKSGIVSLAWGNYNYSTMTYDEFNSKFTGTTIMFFRDF